MYLFLNFVLFCYRKIINTDFQVNTIDQFQKPVFFSSDILPIFISMS